MSDPSSVVLEGNCRDVLRTLPEESVHCCVTSPPYFGLRDYGHDDQIGLEETPDAYVASLVEVFREVRRVLRDDGTLWLNLGDSYCSTDKWGGGVGGNTGKHTTHGEDVPSWAVRRRKPALPDTKPKDLLGIPWMVAFALRADGWYLRQEIIWAKTSCMPESVLDRPTRAHEQVFLLTKRPRYFYDVDAIRETHAEHERHQSEKRREQMGRAVASVDGRGQSSSKGIDDGVVDVTHLMRTNESGRNKRSVWTVGPAPFADAHFATMPPKLAEPCVLAGSPESACGNCGAPYERVTALGGIASMEASERPQQRRAAELAREKGLTDDHLAAVRAVGSADVGRAAATQNGVNADETWALAQEAKEALGGYFREFGAPASVTTGFVRSCECEAEAVPGVVLDPFAGSGTTGVVAAWRGRSFVGIELNPEYAEMARKRIAAEGRLGRRAYRPKAERQMESLF